MILLEIIFTIFFVILIAFSLMSRSRWITSILLVNIFLFFWMSHVYWRIEAQQVYDFSAYLQAILLLGFFVILLVALNTLLPIRGGTIYRFSSVSDSFLIGVFCIWTAATIGIAGSAGLRQDGDALNSALGSSFLITSFYFLISLLFKGALFLYAIRLGLGKAFSGSFPKVLFLIFLISILVMATFNAMSEGVRRTFLVLAVTYAVAGLTRRDTGETGFRLISRNLLIASALFVASAYYQSVRTNAYQPEFTVGIESDRYAEKLSALLFVLTPRFEGEARGQNISVRSGPMDLLVKIVVFREAPGTDGEIMTLNIIRSLPSVLVGEKPPYESDRIILEEYAINPGSSSYIDEYFYMLPDYSLSVVAEFYSDYGFMGVFFLAVFYQLILFSAFKFISYSNSVIIVGAVSGFLFVISASSESNLSWLIVSFRDACVLILISVGAKVLFSAKTVANRANFGGHALSGRSRGRR